MESVAALVAPEVAAMVEVTVVVDNNTADRTNTVTEANDECFTNSNDDR